MPPNGMMALYASRDSELPSDGEIIFEVCDLIGADLNRANRFIGPTRAAG